MAKQIVHRSGTDAKYLHPDFHGALSAGIEYVDEHYGENAVVAYLWQFARAFYRPLNEALRRRGLEALEEHYRRIYELERGTARFYRSDDQLRIEVDACPAVMHMRHEGYPVARLFRETLATVGKAICHETDFDAELLEYDDETGRSVRRFVRRAP